MDELELTSQVEKDNNNTRRYREEAVDGQGNIRPESTIPDSENESCRRTAP